MRLGRWAWLLVCFYFLLPVAWAAEPPPALQVTPDFEVRNLTTYLSYWRDLSTAATLPEAQDALKVAGVPVSNAGNWGYDPAAHWVHFQLSNPGPLPRAMVVKLALPVLDHVNFYMPGRDGSYLEFKSGDSEPWIRRPWGQRFLAFPFVLPPESTQDYYIRLNTSGVSALSARLYQSESFWADVSREQLWQGLFYGAILVVLLYNLFLFVSTGERVYFFYALTLLPITAYLACMDGLFFEFFPFPGLVQNLALPAFVIFSSTASLLFAGHYLDFSQRPRWLKWSRVLLLVTLVDLVLLPLLGPTLGEQITLVITTGVLGFMVAMGLAALRFDREVATYFVLGWSAVLLQEVGVAVGSFGLLPFLDYFDDALKLSILWAVFLLSLGLGKRLRMMKDVQLRSEKEVLLAQAQSRAKSDFLAVMSHEIRTPLNGVMGMAELLKATGLNNEQSRIVATMEASGNSLIEVINDVLDYSKIEAGKMVLEAKIYDVDQLLDECLALFKPRIHKQQLALLCSVARDVPTELKGDVARLRQVVVNLLSNAVKFTARGGIEVIVKAEPHSAEQVALVVTVTDTGIGMNTEQMERIFDSFAQAESSTSRQFGGTGLGLSISRQLCRLMGGDIGVESETGRGSAFHARVLMERVPGTREREFWPTDLGLTRVLLVDSDVHFCQVMQREASLPALLIDTVQTGQEALARLHEAAGQGHPYHYLVTALQLRDMNGLSLHDRTRHDPALAGLKTLLFALPQLQPSPGVLVHAGVVQAFERPVRARELRQALLDALRHGQPGIEAMVPAETAMPQFPGLRVLVAEDNRTNQLVIQGLLRKFGIQPVLVDNGRQAVTVFKASDYDMVLMDCEMPIMDGYTASQEIRRFEAEQKRGRVPILAISAHVTQHYIDNCYAAGMDDHIPKPVSSRTLQEKIERWAAV